MKGEKVDLKRFEDKNEKWQKKGNQNGLKVVWRVICHFATKMIKNLRVI